MTGENPFVLGVDLDGVCADYTKAFRAHAAAVLGRDESSMGEQRSWRIEECDWGIVDRAHFLNCTAAPS